jgi:arylsulfatase A-like enzyme
MVGKWHLGYHDWESTPTYRGFDSFYGYYEGSIGYESKRSMAEDFDLHVQEELVTDEDEKGTHLTLLLQQKVEAVIASHAEEFGPSGVPLFLYYAPQVVP